MEENEVVYDNISLVEEQEAVTVKEVMPVIEVTEVESYEVEMLEAFPAAEGDTSYNHALLNNREISDAHPITAITGLREELDSIEALRTIYSDKKGNADYYEWADGHAIGENGIGYFVTLNKDVRVISICTGDDIFGVVVDSAAFVGGQDDVARDAHYGLVATSGGVLVRCELDVAEGDYVISNSHGKATKAALGCGYKVVALHDINGEPYATINLSISADQINTMGAKLQNLDARITANEENIIFAVNMAHEAHQKAADTDVSNQMMSDKVNDALGTVDKVASDVKDLSIRVSNSMMISTQARAIADSAVTEAERIRAEAVDEANKAITDTSALRDEFKLMEEGITEIDNQISLIVKENSEQGTAIAGIRTKVTDHDAEINNLVSWQGDTNIAMARIEQKADANGAYIQSTVSNMDKYSVGPHSQAYGFTLEQAASVLEEGMIYVPTEDAIETYEYVEDEDTKTYERSFTPGYLYQWGELTSYPYGWITVDKNYKETDETNTSSMAVYFTTIEPTVSDNFGYWYTNGDTITGTTGTYEPYTLYKWESYMDEAGDTQYYWVAVATLTGNSSNRVVSQIRQDANSIAFEVTNPKGSFAGMKAELTETKSDVSSLSAWKNGENTSEAIIRQETNDDGASIVISTLQKDADGNTSEMASLTLVANEDNSALVIDADHINLNGRVTIDDLDSDTAGKLNNSVASTKIEYALSDSSTVAPTDDWNTTAPEWQEGKYMWQKTTITYTDTTKTPTVTMTCIQGAKGEQGIPGNNGDTPEIGENGNWWINNEDTGIKAEGVDGNTPTVEINEDGYWVINDVVTDVKAEGVDGASGVGVTKVVTRYYISDNNTSKPSNDANDDNGWFEDFDTMLTQYWALRDANSKTTYYIWSQERVEYGSGDSTYSTATVNGASSVVTLYCKENGVTKIDGDNIATGTVTAGKMDVDNLSAISANLGTVNVGCINITDGIKTRDTTTASEGLEFTLNDEGTEYSITGIGDCTDADIIIPATYNNLPVTSIGASAFHGCTSLIRVTIDGNVDSIEKQAFQGCSGLVNVIIGNGVTSIGDNAFYNCKSLTSVIIGNSVITIGTSAFYGCSSLASIAIPDSVTSIGSEAFWGCSSLTSATIGNGVTSIGYQTFYGCDKLAIVKLGSGLETINIRGFGACDCLRSIVIPDGVTSIGSYAFAYCTSLTSITIPDSVTSIGSYAFQSCSNIDKVYYRGSTEDMWNLIEIGSYNDGLINATRYYYVDEANWSSSNLRVWCYDNNEGLRENGGKQYIINSPYFKVTSNGELTATLGTFSGELTAATGTFSGVLSAAMGKFGSGTLGSDNSVFISTDNMNGTVCGRSWSNWRLTVGSNFGVSSNGTLCAQQIHLGDYGIGSDSSIYVSTSDISGTVCDTTLDNWRLTVGSNFGVASDGSMYARVGNIAGWTITSSSLTQGTFGSSGIHLFSTASTGGGHFGADSSGTFHWMMGIGSNFGVTADGSMYAKAGKLGGWTLSANQLVHYGDLNDGETDDYVGLRDKSFCMQINHGNTVNAIAIGKVSRQSWATAGFRITHDGAIKIQDQSKQASSLFTIINENKDYQLRLYSNAIGFTSGSNSNDTLDIGDPSITYDGSQCLLIGTWVASECLASGSDRDIKYGIEDLADKYEVIFDNLRPVRFKYNHGKSNRYHTGFIAQEVEAAVIESGLTTQDFAAVCYSTTDEGVKTDYTIRYGEIVSLNTYEIQKLKARTVELESKVAELGAKLTELTTTQND